MSMRVHRLAIPVLLVPLAASAQRPHMPIAFTGWCPLECCTLQGQWRAPEPTRAHTSRNLKSRVVFTIAKDEAVTALTQVLVTTRPGVVTIAGPTRVVLDPFMKSAPVTRSVTLTPRDTIYTLVAGGEGTDAYLSYHGKTYHTTGSFDVYGVHPATEQQPYAVLSTPVHEWWVRMKNAKGAVGWTLDPSRFSRTGQCG